MFGVKVQSMFRTLTTLELALLCSYARKAVLTSGIVETLENKSVEIWSSFEPKDEVDADATESAGVG